MLLKAVDVNELLMILFSHLGICEAVVQRELQPPQLFLFFLFLLSFLLHLSVLPDDQRCVGYSS